MSLSALGWGSAAFIVATLSSTFLNSSIEIIRRPLFSALYFFYEDTRSSKSKKGLSRIARAELTACNEDRTAIDSAQPGGKEKNDECLPSLRVAKKTNE